jgi:hypothetical protein
VRSSGAGWGGGLERGAGPAYRGGGAGESAGVVFDVPVGVGGRGDHGERVGGAVVGDGRLICCASGRWPSSRQLVSACLTWEDIRPY